MVDVGSYWYQENSNENVTFRFGDDLRHNWIYVHIVYRTRDMDTKLVLVEFGMLATEIFGQ